MHQLTRIIFIIYKHLPRNTILQEFAFLGKLIIVCREQILLMYKMCKAISFAGYYFNTKKTIQELDAKITKTACMNNNYTKIISWFEPITILLNKIWVLFATVTHCERML